MTPFVDLVVTFLAMLLGVVGTIISSIALRQIKRIDQHGKEIDGQTSAVVSLGKDVEYMKKSLELQAIEMKGMDKKLTDFIIDYSKGVRTRKR